MDRYNGYKLKPKEYSIQPNDVIIDILEVLKLLGLVDYEYRQVEKDKTNLFITKMSNKVGG